MLAGSCWWHWVGQRREEAEDAPLLLPSAPRETHHRWIIYTNTPSLPSFPPPPPWSPCSLNTGHCFNVSSSKKCVTSVRIKVAPGYSRQEESWCVAFAGGKVWSGTYAKYSFQAAAAVYRLTPVVRQFLASNLWGVETACRSWNCPLLSLL